MDGSVVHFTKCLDFQVISVDAEIAFSRNVFVDVFSEVLRKVFTVLCLKKINLSQQNQAQINLKLDKLHLAKISYYVVHAMLPDICVHFLITVKLVSNSTKKTRSIFYHFLNNVSFFAHRLFKFSVFFHPLFLR